MIVQCDKCSAKYRIPDEKIKSRGVRVKCTKCQNVFTVTAPSSETQPAPEPPAPAQKGRPPVSPDPPLPPPEPSAPGPSSAPSARGLDFEQAFRDSQSRTLDAASRPAEPGAVSADKPTAAPSAGGLDWGNISLGGEPGQAPSDTGGFGLTAAMKGGETGASPPPEPLPFTAPSPEEGVPAPQARTPQPLAAEAPSRGGRAFLILFLILAILGGGGYLAYKNPRVKALLGRGTETAVGTLAVEGVKVTGLRNLQGVEIAVVRGSVRNNASSSQGMIRVEAQFKDGRGKILKRVAAYCGNVFTDRELQARPAAEIVAAMSNELGQSLVNSSVPVGQSVPFMVVLENPPRDIAQVTVTILSYENR